MTHKALGLIEVRGYLGAVVAADAAIKAANVSLLNIETVKAGLNTVQLTGDIGAVKAAVDAGVDAVREEPYYLTSHVIPRLDSQAELLLTSKKDLQDDKVSKDTEILQEESMTKKEVSLENHNEIQETAGKPPSSPTTDQARNENSVVRFERTSLEKLKVVDLRRLAYRETEIDLTKKEIKFANKNQLLEALTNLARKE